MKKFLRILVAVLGCAVVPCLVLAFFAAYRAVTGDDLQQMLIPWVNVAIFVVALIISGIIFIPLSKRITEAIEKLIAKADEITQKASAKSVLSRVAGLAVGLLIAYLICTLFDKINSPLINITASVLVYVVCALFCMRIVYRSVVKPNKNKGEAAPGSAKVLDTSAIIDGRIYYLCKTGIIEGSLIIPNFVLDELRHIADSADALKRTKGRKGLDTLHRMQEELTEIRIEVVSKEYPDIPEVDVKLLKLAEDLGGKVITNDFNLNKVAMVKGVPVINVNDISNAVKPVLSAGEELLLEVMKEGKDPTQGVGYLDDGTMIVVESGSRFIGQQIVVVVTSVLQTSAGRMIFAKPKE